MVQVQIRSGHEQRRCRSRHLICLFFWSVYESTDYAKDYAACQSQHGSDSYPSCEQRAAGVEIAGALETSGGVYVKLKRMCFTVRLLRNPATPRLSGLVCGLTSNVCSLTW